jgi:hypothetical protein
MNIIFDNIEWMAFVSLIVLIVCAVYTIKWSLKRDLLTLAEGDTWYIESRHKDINATIEILRIDTKKGTVSYFVKRSDGVCFTKEDEKASEFFLHTVLNNNATYSKFIGNKNNINQ